MKATFLIAMVSGFLSGAELKDVKSVYLYPMVGGLDQHLANQLTKDHVFRVVADPKLADALFTDQLGQQFEYRVDHIKRDAALPTPPPAAVASTPGTPVPAETEPHGSSFSRGKGTIFLVDAKTRQVVWADYRKPKNTSSRELEKTAKQLAMNITKILAPPASTK